MKSKTLQIYNEISAQLLRVNLSTSYTKTIFAVSVSES